jgi:hypothetical protein
MTLYVYRYSLHLVFVSLFVVHLAHIRRIAFWTGFPAMFWSICPFIIELDYDYIIFIYTCTPRRVLCTFVVIFSLWIFFWASTKPIPRISTSYVTWIGLKVCVGGGWRCLKHYLAKVKSTPDILSRTLISSPIINFTAKFVKLSDVSGCKGPKHVQKNFPLGGFKP